MSTTDWQPTATRAQLAARARLLAAIRSFFAERGVLEVETPVLSQAATTAPHLHSFVTRLDGVAGAPVPLYLQTSPEFAMKRLLAAGSGPIYQLCKVFRNGERGPRHNPEFTLLEWYRPGWALESLMDEVEALLRRLLEARCPDAIERVSYRELFVRHAGIDAVTADAGALRDCLRGYGHAPVEGLDPDDPDPWRDLLLTHVIEPRLTGRALFVYDYPASQAALARLNPADPRVAERFELFVDGVELANGFRELTNADEQRRRFEAELAARARAGLPPVPVDQRLLAALEAGLPECSGVAVGVDRLLMLASGASDLASVLAFPVERA